MLHSHLGNLITRKRSQRVLGVMTGTSLDGVDLCLCNFTDSILFPSDPLAPSKPISEIIKIEKFATLPYPSELLKLLRDLLSAASTHSSTPAFVLSQVCVANTMWSREIGKLINEFLKDVGDEVDFSQIIIASHGQTLWHISGDSTLQIGDTEVLAQVTNRIVVGNFRAADVACGGSGAPLVPFLDRFLASDAMKKHLQLSEQQQLQNKNNNCPSCGLVLLQNLGGIGNVSLVLTLNENEQHILSAFDTGPANVILNELILSLTMKEGRCNEFMKILTKKNNNDKNDSNASSWQEDFLKLLPLADTDQPLPLFDENGFYSSRGTVIPHILEFCATSEFMEVLLLFLNNLKNKTNDVLAVSKQFDTFIESIERERTDKENESMPIIIQNQTASLVEAFRRILTSMFRGRSTGREDFGASFVSTVMLHDLTNFMLNGANAKSSEDEETKKRNVTKFSTPEGFFQYFCDLCATAVAFTAKSIAMHLEIVDVVWKEFLKRFCRIHQQQEQHELASFIIHHPVIMLCSGGGSLHPGIMKSIAEENSFLVDRVAKLSSFVQFFSENGKVEGDLADPCNDVAFEELDDAKEAIAFALLGHEKMCSLCCKNGENVNLGTNEPAATGARKKCFLGQISCP